MIVWQCRLKIFVLRDISVNTVQSKLASFIDKGFSTSEALLRRHEERGYCGYCFDYLYPIEKDKIYHKNKIYTLTIRTIDPDMARYFNEICVNNFTEDMKGLTSELRVLPRKRIETLYSLTPAIIKTEKGYWKSQMNIQEYMERLRINLIKKWNYFENASLNEDFEFCNLFEFLNQGPIPIEYKGVTLLGDKIKMEISDNDTAQKLAYMSLGTGVLENNGRGAGFVNYRWL